MADAADSKSADGNIVRVQVPPSAPIQQKNRIHYGFFVVCSSKLRDLNRGQTGKEKISRYLFPFLRDGRCSHIRLSMLLYVRT